MSQAVSEIYIPLCQAGVDQALAASAARAEIWPATAAGAKNDLVELRQLETLRVIAELRGEVALLRKEIESLRAERRINRSGALSE
jgi:uncharacterized small protein (DUF1192 family)